MTFKYAYGITNQCNNGSQVYFADIDNQISLDDLETLVHDLGSLAMFRQIYVFKSKNGYNLIALDKVSSKFIYMTNRHFRDDIDQLYNEMQYRERGFYTLRVSKDKQYVGSVTCWGDKSPYVQSNAHRMFLNQMFHIPIKKTELFDDETHVRIIKFMNQKYGYEEVDVNAKGL